MFYERLKRKYFIGLGSLCLKIENQFVPAEFVNSNKNNVNRTISQSLNKTQCQDKQSRNFYPKMAHMARKLQITNNLYRFAPPRPNIWKPQPRPKLMDVNSSMRTSC